APRAGGDPRALPPAARGAGGVLNPAPVGTMIALAGEQAAATLLPALASPPRQLYQIASERTLERALAVRAALKLDPRTRRVGGEDVCDVDPYALADTEQAIERILTGCPPPVTINATGGTKIMSLAAFGLAQRHGLETIYLVTERNELL